MSRLLLVRLACIAGLLGSALVIGSFFLPLRAVSVAFPPAPATNGTDSYWSMLSQTATGGTMNIGVGIIVLVFILSILIPAILFLGGLF